MEREKNYENIQNEWLPSKHSAFTMHNCSSVQSMIYMYIIHLACIQWNLASFEVTQKFKPPGHDFKSQTRSLHCIHNTIPSLQSHLLCILYVESLIHFNKPARELSCHLLLFRSGSYNDMFRILNQARPRSCSSLCKGETSVTAF